MAFDRDSACPLLPRKRLRESRNEPLVPQCEDAEVVVRRTDLNGTLVPWGATYGLAVGATRTDRGGPVFPVLNYAGPLIRRLRPLAAEPEAALAMGRLTVLLWMLEIGGVPDAPANRESG